MLNMYTGMSAAVNCMLAADLNDNLESCLMFMNKLMYLSYNINTLVAQSFLTDYY